MTCCRTAHSSSGVELSFSSHWARALSLSCSKLSVWLMVLSFVAFSLVDLLVPCLFCFCRILKATFDLSIWCSVQQLASRMARVLWMSISQLCDDILFDSKAHSGLPSFTFRFFYSSKKSIPSRWEYQTLRTLFT